MFERYLGGGGPKFPLKLDAAFKKRNSTDEFLENSKKLHYFKAIFRKLVQEKVPVSLKSS